MADKDISERRRELDKVVDEMPTLRLIVTTEDALKQLMVATNGVLNAQRTPNSKDSTCLEFLVASGVSNYYEKKLYDRRLHHKNEGTLTEVEERAIGIVARGYMHASQFVNNAQEICSKPPEAETERAPERQRPTIPYSPHRIDM